MYWNWNGKKLEQRRMHYIDCMNKYYELSMKVTALEALIERVLRIEMKLKGSEAFTKDLLKELGLNTRRVEATEAHGEIYKVKKGKK